MTPSTEANSSAGAAPTPAPVRLYSCRRALARHMPSTRRAALPLSATHTISVDAVGRASGGRATGAADWATAPGVRRCAIWGVSGMHTRITHARGVSARRRCARSQHTCGPSHLQPAHLQPAHRSQHACSQRTSQHTCSQHTYGPRVCWLWAHRRRCAFCLARPQTLASAAALPFRQRRASLSRIFVTVALAPISLRPGPRLAFGSAHSLRTEHEVRHVPRCNVYYL